MNIPKIRFPEFSGEWEEKKFSDLVNLKDGLRRGPFGSSLKKEFFIEKSEYVVYEQQNAIYDRFNTRYNISKEKYEELKNFNITVDDFIMSGAGTIGKISRVPNGIKKGIFNQALIRIRINIKTVHSEYFLQFMRSDIVQQKLTSGNPGSAMSNLVPMTEIKEWKLKIPSFEEQQKIGNFFKKLDDSISLQKNKLANLKTTKKALLQKMFPKNGETVPEIRFPEFSGEWEEKKLEEVVELIRSYSLSREVEIEEKSGFRYIHYGDIHRKVANLIENEEVLSNIVPGKYQLLQKDDLVLADASEDYIGIAEPSILLVTPNDNIVAGLHTIAIRPKELNSLFLYYILYTDDFKKFGSKVGTGMKVFGITATNLFKYEILYPTLQEQQKIGNFFKKLDTLISLNQQNLENLEKRKKALLQKMFV